MVFQAKIVLVRPKIFQMQLNKKIRRGFSSVSRRGDAKDNNGQITIDFPASKLFFFQCVIFGAEAFNIQKKEMIQHKRENMQKSQTAKRPERIEHPI